MLCRLLRPISDAEVAALVHPHTADSPGEHLSLADAGQEDEVRELLAGCAPTHASKDQAVYSADAGANDLSNHGNACLTPTGTLYIQGECSS